MFDSQMKRLSSMLVNPLLPQSRIHLVWAATLLFCIGLMPSGFVFGQVDGDDEIRVENIWPADIIIEDAPPVPIVDPAYMDLWMEQLERDETDVKQELIAKLEQVHHAGIDLSGKVMTIRGLVNQDNHHSVNMALISLLVALDDRESAPMLFEMIQPNQIEDSQIVEPALAKWKYSPAVELWRKRLQEENVRRTHLLLAINGLAAVGDKDSVDSLLSIATDVQYERPSIRLAAARAIGEIGGEHLVEECTQLADSQQANPRMDRLCCVAMLAKQDSDEAIALLQELMCDESGAVAGAAWKRILEIDSKLALPYVERCAGSQDPMVREAIVTTWLEQPNLDRIDLLGAMLDDRHPDVRNAARKALMELSTKNDQFDKRVVATAMKSVDPATTSYRGIEQGLLLLTALDHKPVADRAAMLLDHQHPNVNVTAAWALRNLRVKDTYEKMLQRATKISMREIGKFNSGTKVSLIDLEQVAHLFDAFGEAQYEPAANLLERFIPVVADPKDTTNPKGLGANSRAAAITALGKIYRDDPDRGLVSQMVQRLNARGRTGAADVPEVWATAAIALGRMKATSEVDQLKQYYTGEPPVDGANYACAWAIRELTGEDFPPPVPREFKVHNFKVTPTDARMTTSDDEN